MQVKTGLPDRWSGRRVCCSHPRVMTISLMNRKMVGSLAVLVRLAVALLLHADPDERKP